MAWEWKIAPDFLSGDFPRPRFIFLYCLLAITYHPEAKEGIAAMMRDCAQTRRQGVYVQNVKRVTLDNVCVEGAGKEFEFVAIDEIEGVQ